MEQLDRYVAGVKREFEATLRALVEIGRAHV
jgi:hypothetical protein